FIIFLSIIGGVFIVTKYFSNPEILKSSALIITVILFIGGLQLFFLSIIGEYVITMFEEVKGRPKYLIKNILNNKKKNEQ
ncbi:hypothetical protein L6259_03980, partial [Candidatus Parcubacteria bacterium]|nr:hypothetical protein [Candidatus Parcubacteria bacterium]